MIETEIMKLYRTTSLTYAQIAEMLGIKMWKVASTISNYTTVESRYTRKSQNYRESKIGNKNPMKGKTKELHHNYIGDISDGKGYILVLKPTWYTGRKGTKHVFKHHVVMCQELGITAIPKGMCVHHIDEDKTNNSIDNLAYMTTSAHAKLHQRSRYE